MNLSELQKDIARWGMATFGETDPARIGTRMNVEVAELLIELDAIRWAQIQGEWPKELIEKARYECADVFIMLAQVHALLGGDLAADVEEKMRINRARVWATNDKGQVRHLEEKQASSDLFWVVGTGPDDLRPAEGVEDFVEEGCGHRIRLDMYYAVREGGGLFPFEHYNSAQEAYNGAIKHLEGSSSYPIDRRCVSIPKFLGAASGWEGTEYINIMKGADLYVYWAYLDPEIAKEFK